MGAAGTGKTTAMTAFACALEAAGGRVIGLAPSAAAAAVLGAELEVPADTLHKLLDVHARAKAVAGPNGRVPDGAIEPRYALDARSVLLVDEAGMAGTPELAAVLELAERYGASIRLLGDPSQLAAVGSGGALRLIDHYVGAAHLEEVRRFLLADGKTTNEKEARASLQLRKGNPVGLDYYVENDRARGGTREAMIEDVYAAWATDMAAGDSAIMVAATNDVVVELNARARRDRVIAGRVKEDGVFLHDGGTAGVGDIVVSRRNDRRLRTGPSDFVKNGDLWRVTRHYHDGALSVVHRDTKASVTLPAGYVAEWIELGYAATVHRVQGMTVDAGHLLVDETMTRDHLYTGATRGRYMNRMYVVTDAVLDVDLHEQPDPARAVRQTLEQVLDRTEGDPAALEALVTEWDSAHSLAQLVPAYEDAHTRLLEPDREQRIATLLHEQIPAHADRILTDPAWPALLARLARHENSGSDLRQLLPNALAEREIGTADSLAQVLHWRIGDPEPEPGESNLPSWVTPAPQEDPEPTQDPAPQPQVEADPAEDETLADQKIPDVRVDPGEPAYREAVEINTAAWTWWNQQSDSSDSWTATYRTPGVFPRPNPAGRPTGGTDWSGTYAASATVTTHSWTPEWQPAPVMDG
ncbi:AAA family ATPase [Miniimonas sp. S16]|uniref:AAA family ATPase n=1 Tax=Miniimonas sp. S16 TaxID=2171623 RepID=UPI001F1C9284|nr:AAA family ATPase [Miniimonas sp. S16]